MMWCPEAPIWAAAKSSLISLSLTELPLIRYSLEESRCTTRSSDTSSKSIGRILFSLSNTTFTDARLRRPADCEPLKMRSSPRLPRIDLMDCSPSTKRNASATFDLPEPLGPTIEVIGAANSKLDFLAKDLKPEISRLFRYIQYILTFFHQLKKRCDAFVNAVLPTFTKYSDFWRHIALK